MTPQTASPVLPHNEKAGATWSAGGDDYEKISRGIAGAIDHAIDRLRLTGTERVLDLACGTGLVSRKLGAEQRGLSLLGVDIAQGLVDAARGRAARAGLPIEYEVGDAEALPCDDASFDAVVSSFGIMFASQPEAAAREMARVTRRGGRCALLTWKPNSAIKAMFEVMRPYMNIPSPPPASPFAWGDPARVRELLGQGWELRFEEGVQPFLAAGAEDAWNIFATGYGPVRVLHGNLPSDRAAAFRADLTAFFQQYATELGVNQPREYLLTVGTKR